LQGREAILSQVASSMISRPSPIPSSRLHSRQRSSAVCQRTSSSSRPPQAGQRIFFVGAGSSLMALL